MKISHQLTKHPIGSLREIWTISWPLMLGLLSVSFMMFADRLLLSRFSLAALDASASAGMATYVLMILPMTIAGISEVFVGRSHGEGRFKCIGKPVWQMIWFSFMLTPFFWIAGKTLSPLFFYGTGNESLENEYFEWILNLAPFTCASIALMGFFVGTGRVKIITLGTISANIINVGLATLLIYGYGPIPSMGVKGAAIATGIAQCLQATLFLILFMRPKFQIKYGTHFYQFDCKIFLDCVKLGFPVGLGHILEVLAHFCFFRIIIMAGEDRLTIVALVQTLYGLVGFLTEAVSKAVTTLISNLIGGAKHKLIGKVLRSAMTMHFLFFCVSALIVLFFTKPIMSVFFSPEEQLKLSSPEFFNALQSSCLWMCVFFLFEGFYWILYGHLTACGDTKFIFFSGLVMSWTFCVVPAYLIISVGHGSGDFAWMLLAISSLVNMLAYLWRYFSGKWAAATLQRPQEESAISSAA